MNRFIRRSTIGRLTGALLVTAGLLAGMRAYSADAGAVLPCAAGRPCITDMYAADDTVNAQWNGNWDAYHVIWEITRPGQGQEGPTTQRLPQGETRSHSGGLAYSDGDKFATYRVSVQGCTKHTFGHDECTPWTSREIIPALPYGDDTCADGFVWRDAFYGDHTCVTPSARDQAATDNAYAASRRSPNGGAYGPDTCKNGYVWREARDGDHVCVTPQVRAQTAQDNQLANGRRAEPLGSITQY